LYCMPTPVLPQRPISGLAGPPLKIHAGSPLRMHQLMYSTPVWHSFR